MGKEELNHKVSHPILPPYLLKIFFGHLSLTSSGLHVPCSHYTSLSGISPRSSRWVEFQQLLLHPCSSLQCLWELGKATSQAVHSSSRESLRQERNPAIAYSRRMLREMTHAQPGRIAPKISNSLWVFVFRQKVKTAKAKKKTRNFSVPSGTVAWALLTPALSQVRIQGLMQQQNQPVARKVPAQISVPVHLHREDCLQTSSPPTMS